MVTLFVTLQLHHSLIVKVTQMISGDPKSDDTVLADSVLSLIIAEVILGSLA